MSDDEREEQPESVLEGLRPFAWSNEQSVSYEVALELISQVVAEYNGLISRERAKESPRTERIAAWTASKQEHIAQRRALQVDDTASVARLHAESTQLLHELRTSRERG
jgi:hypothetical protein